MLEKINKILCIIFQEGVLNCKVNLILLIVPRNTILQFYGGPVWFSITEGAAKWIVSKSDFIKKVFKNTYCCDEIFAQTVLMNSPFANNIYKYSNNNCL
ncbi:MAG: beta-1,6-N-acetylglucosaminyltransferase [Ruminococcus sp.]